MAVTRFKVAVKEVIRLEKENRFQKEEIERLQHGIKVLCMRGNDVQGKIDVKLWVSFVLVLNFV
jgi:hypothetical protein